MKILKIKFILIAAIAFFLQVNAKREQNDVIKIGEVVVVALPFKYKFSIFVCLLNYLNLNINVSFNFKWCEKVNRHVYLLCLLFNLFIEL